MPNGSVRRGQHLAWSGRSLNSSLFRPVGCGLRVFSRSSVPCFRTQTSDPHPECLETFDRPKLTNESTNGRDLELLVFWNVQALPRALHRTLSPKGQQFHERLFPNWYLTLANSSKDIFDGRDRQALHKSPRVHQLNT